MGKHNSEDVRAGAEFGPDSIEGGIRERVREVIQAIVNEELEVLRSTPNDTDRRFSFHSQWHGKVSARSGRRPAERCA